MFINLFKKSKAAKSKVKSKVKLGKAKSKAVKKKWNLLILFVDKRAIQNNLKEAYVNCDKSNSLCAWVLGGWGACVFNMGVKKNRKQYCTVQIGKGVRL